MKQTAVEWLVNELDLSNDTFTMKIINQAKAMEKQQIIDAHLDGQCFSTTIEEIDYAEQYYTETYNKTRNEYSDK